MAFVFISASSVTSDLSRQECGLVNDTTTRANNTNMMVTTLKSKQLHFVDHLVLNNRTSFLFIFLHFVYISFKMLTFP